MRLTHSKKSILEGKMLLYMFLVLGVWKGVIGRDDFCNTRSYRNCLNSEEMRYFPKTEEDIDRQCQHYAHYLECLKDYVDKCGYENVNYLFSEDKYQTFKNLVEDVCQSDSQLHLRVVQNVGCISELVDNSQKECRKYSQSKTEVLNQYIRNKTIEENYDVSSYNKELGTPFLCVSESLQFACLASEVSKRCGSDAQEVLVEIVSRSGILKDLCPSDSEDRINDLIRILELEMEEERFLKEIINKE